MYIATTPWDWPGLGDIHSLCRQAEAAEAIGLHSFWLPESHFSGVRAIPSPLTLLAAVAARTTHIRLGCTSYLLPIRHPLQAAEEVAVLDQLSGGRLILGLGRGLQRDMFRAFGVASTQKRSLFRQNLDLMRRAWRGEKIPCGDDAQTTVVLSPLPVQQPELPLWVAAFGPKALQQVAELGLPYLASPVESLDVLEGNYRRHTELVTRQGMPAPAVVPIMRTVYVAQQAHEAQAVKASLAKELEGRGMVASAVESCAIIGDRLYVSDKLAEYRERTGMSHLIARMGLRGLSGDAQLRSLGALLELGVASTSGRLE